MKICKEISSLRELEEGYSIPDVGDNDALPCYHRHISSTVELEDEVPVADYLNLLAEDLASDSLVTFSVSSREERYEEWLDAVAMYPGAHVTEIVRKVYRGGNLFPPYSVFFCTFPVTPQFPE